MLTDTIVTVGARVRPMTTRSLTPKESERVRIAIRELLMVEKTQTALAKRLGVSQQALSAVIRGTATGGYAIARAVAKAKGASDVDAWLRGAAPGRSAPRIRDQPGYEEALAVALKVFRRVPRDAFEDIGNLMGDRLPEVITAEFLGRMASSWTLNATDDERAEVIVAQAELEMEEEDRKAAVLATSGAPANTPR